MTSVRAALLAIVALCGVSAAPHGASATPLEQALFDAHIERAAGSAGVLAIAEALDATDLDAWVGRDAAIASWDGLASATSDPTVRTIAQYAALRLAWSRGTLEDAERREQAMGFITDWAVVGPFANDGMAGFSARLGPEELGVDRSATFPGKVVDVQWRELVGAAETGYLDLTSYMQPAWSAVAYVAVDLDVPRAFEGTLALAVDGAYRVWLDGAPLAEQPQHLGGWLLRDAVPVRMTRGRHQLMIKIAVDDSAMGLHARFLDADGAPVDLGAVPAQRTGVVAQPSDAWPQATTLTDRFAPLLDDPGADADTLAAVVATLVSFQPADPAEPWTPFVERALAGAPGAKARVRLAPGLVEHWRRVDVVGADAPGADDPEVRLVRAILQSEEMGETPAADALTELRRLVDDFPSYGSAQLALTQSMLGSGLYYAQLEALLSLAEATDWAPPVLPDLAAAASRLNRRDLSYPIAVQIALHGLDSAWAVEQLVDVLRERGDTDEANRWVEAYAERVPNSISALAVLARHEVARGDLGAAVEAYDRAIELSPGDAELFNARGALWLELGDTESAASDFEASLTRAPQNYDIRTYLARIAPDSDTFYEAFRVGVDALIAARDASEPAPDVDYEWLVDQRIVHVYPNGLATTYVQQAFDVRTRGGADALRSMSLAYAPDSEIVAVVAVRVVKPDGTVREVYDTDDYGPGSGPSSIYYDVRSRAVFVPSLEPGDVLSWEYTIADVSFRNIFDDYFGDVMFLQSHQPRALVRWGALMPASRTLYTNADTLGFGTWRDEDRGDERLLVFEARDVPRVAREANTPGPAERFAYLGASTYDSWDALANWYWHLVEDQLVLSPAIEQTVAELIDGLDDDRERIAAIHEYVVRNTRYVGLEFGIHGFKPYRTSDIFTRRFGDCKDTASLIKVMLEAAGIEAHLALVRTRDLGNIDAYPPSLAVFNHAIAYVPAYDLFLDGTAGFSGSGELPSLDQGASAVVVLDGEGGRFVRIAELPASDSTSTTRLRVTLDEAGARGDGTLRLSGNFAPGLRRAYESADQPVEQFSDRMAGQFPGLRVETATFSDVTDITVPVDVEFAFVGGDWAAVQGDGSVVVHPLGGDSELAGQLAGASTRIADLELDYPFVLDERYEIRVPPEWVPGGMPEPTRLETPFGSLEYGVELAGGVLTGAMRFEIAVTRVAAADYPAFRQFVVDAETALNQVVRFEAGGAR